MARQPNEEPDLALAEELIFGDRGVVLQRYGRAETRAARTPDFRVLQGGKVVAFCEVKSPRDDWLDEQLDRAPIWQIVGGPRPDPTFNRIARHVEKAASQFDAVNADRAHPNILVFVNHADATGFGDLLETLTGTFHTSSGEQFPTVRHISGGRIGSARTKIDLYAWIDLKTRRVQGYLFNDLTPHHVQAVCDLLGLDAAAIER